jgi:tetratricopeptide (TPR) repeat protein
MNKFFVVAAATALAFNVNAQSVQEGEKMINYGRFESAKKVLEPLAAKDPQANYYLGIAELELENKDAARAIFGKYPEDFYNQAGMARILFKDGKKEEASKALLAITDKAKKKEWEKYKVAADAITYTKGGNPTDAIAWYKKSIEINNADANTYIGLGDAYLKMQGGGGEAMTNYEAAVEKGTNNSLAYAKIGSLWYAAHNYDAALKSYEQAKNTDPSNPLPYRDLADAYQRAGKYENALQNIEKFLSLSDKSIDDQITYANLLFLSGKYPEAKVKIQELIAKGVEKPYLYRLIGYSAFETKEYPKALENMRLFFSKEKNEDKIINDDYVYTGRIMSALAGQDSSKAKQYNDSADYYFNKVVAMDTSKDKSQLYTKIAEGFKDSKEYAKAGQWYGKIVSDNPNAPALDYFNWGLYSFYGKNLTEATKAFQAMRAKYPDEASAIYWQARVAAAIDSEAKTGGAVQPYKDWLAFNKEGYEHKKADLMNAYQYLAFYYYNGNNETETMTYINKILELEPSNEFANQVKEYYQKLKTAPKGSSTKGASTKK